jgi:hypothetical protein
MIIFHDPRGERSQSEEVYALSCDVSENEGQGITLGLLANGFPDSENFLRHIGDVFKQRLPGLKIKIWNKGNASIPAPETMLEDIRKSCQAVVAAYGH